MIAHFPYGKTLKKAAVFMGTSLLFCLLLVISTIAYAGSLAPLLIPAATSFTLEDIYVRLTTNAAATEASHIFAPSASPAGSMHTLKQIYQAIPTITATKVLSGTTYLGVAGSAYGDSNSGYVLATASVRGAALKNLWNGSSGSIIGGGQGLGGVDDYNKGGSAPADRYVSPAGWTSCVVGNSYCGTNDTGALVKDNATGLIWSNQLNSSYVLDGNTAFTNWFIANNCNESSGVVCTKKTSSKTGCEATAGWSLPTQKQLMQAYIDGSYGTVTNVGNNHWSSTTISTATTQAWVVILTTGATSNASVTKTTVGASVQCVR